MAECEVWIMIRDILQALADKSTQDLEEGLR